MEIGFNSVKTVGDADKIKKVLQSDYLPVSSKVRVPFGGYTVQSP